MKNFIVYHMATGAIARIGRSDDASFPHQAVAERGEAVIEGTVTTENMVIDGVPTYIAQPPPPPPTPEELEADDERQFHAQALGLIGKAIFLHENRIRVLEGKPEITWAQFKTAIRSLL